MVQLHKYVLCRPQGGLNDILSEIGKCLNYARKYDRVVIVETNYFDLTHFNDDFSHYFTSHDAHLAVDGLQLDFDTLTCIPQFIEGRVTSYVCDPKTVGIEVTSGWPVSFDFTKDHAAPLLVHHSNGQQKGRNAISALEVLRLAGGLQDRLKLRLAKLGDYAAVHIRHTDYKTDYEKRMVALAQRVTGHVFVATDNADVLKYCKMVFGDGRVFSFSQLPDDGGKPLHHARSARGARQRNEDAVLDLFTLALAREFYFYPRITGGLHVRPSYSGFSILVDRLRHEPRLLHRIVTGEDNVKLRHGGKIANGVRQLLGR